MLFQEGGPARTLGGYGDFVLRRFTCSVVQRLSDGHHELSWGTSIFSSPLAAEGLVSFPSVPLNRLFIPLNCMVFYN